MKVIMLFFLLIGFHSNAKQENLETKGAVNNYQLKRYNISTGGGNVQAGNYKLTSSIGQPDAGIDLSRGDYNLQGGFLNQIRISDVIFKSSFE